ncbi:hypothetical protein GOBAR_AA24233 [Gossypium barbadense]|uniref:Uncharacterized protein n=1 Tax=Gossypium barbadense TaxID=3634 RepID=A0A2P5WZC1_GOSBA|nr:hypothetical protein GOBAR_AA24233 [Gossypium barbadense]
MVNRCRRLGGEWRQGVVRIGDKGGAAVEVDVLSQYRTRPVSTPVCLDHVARPCGAPFVSPTPVFPHGLEHARVHAHVPSTVASHDRGDLTHAMPLLILWGIKVQFYHSLGQTHVP